MKSFIQICKMTQPEVKAHMKNYLTDLGYDVIDEDGFLYAKGDVPVLLVAHMDTVHEAKCTEVIITDGKISSPQGIGGDDRCGIYIISQIVKEKHCSVLLCEDEEIGTVGARKFTKTNYINNLDVNYMIEFDRKGNSDAVFYSCDNAEFTDFVTEATGYVESHGSFSDISVLMPAAKLAAVNLSSGYYNAHTVAEYVIPIDMDMTIAAALAMIESEFDEPFEYVAKTYNWTRPSSSYEYQYNMLRDYTTMTVAEVELANSDIELEAIIQDEQEKEKCVCVSGKTKAECWMRFFLQYPDYCFSDIVTYSWA